MMGGWGGWEWVWVSFGLVMMVLFWGVLIALAVWLGRGLFLTANRPPGSARHGDLSAREILDRRFARGEISREEYNLMRETISSEIP